MNEHCRDAQIAVERATHDASSLSEFGQSMVQAMANHIAFDRFNIGFIDIERCQFVDAFVAGNNVAGRSTGHVRTLNGTVVQAAILAGDGYFFGDADRQQWLEQFPGFGPVLDSGIRAMLAVPLHKKNEVFASLVFASCDPAAYGSQSLAVAVAVGHGVTKKISEFS